MQLQTTLLFFVFLSLVSFSSQESDNSSSDKNALLKKSVRFSYFLGNGFVHTLSSNTGPTPSLVQEIEQIFDKEGTTISDLLSISLKVSGSYLGFIVLIIFGLIFVIFLPIIGLIFLCCRCCGKSNGYMNLVDEKKDPCRRGFYSIILILLITLKTAALVVAFINNYLANVAINQDEVMSVPFVHGLQQVNDSLWATVQRTKDTNLSGDLEDEKKAFNSVLDTAFVDFKSIFRKESHAGRFIEPIDKFIKLSHQYQTGQENERVLMDFLKALDQLPYNLEEIGTEIKKQLNECLTDGNTQKIMSMKETVDKKLKPNNETTTAFDSGAVKNVLSYLNEHQDKINKLNEFNEYWTKLNVKEKIQKELDDAWESLSTSQEYRNRLAQSFETGLQFITPQFQVIMQQFEPEGSFIQKSKELENTYRYYIGYGILCIPSLIAVCLYFGVCYGICGRRPREDVGCCNKSVGANFLMGAVVLIFLFAPILMLICVSLFTSFGLTESLVCGPLGEPSSGSPATLDIAYQMSIKRALDNRSLHWVKDLTPFESMWLRCKDESMVNAFGGGMIKLQIDDELKAILREMINKINTSELKEEVRNSIVSTSASLQAIEEGVKDLQFDAAVQAIQSQQITYIEDWTIFFADLNQFDEQKFEPSINKLKEQVVEPLDNVRGKVASYLQDLTNLKKTWDQIKTNLEVFSSDMDEKIDSAMNKGVEKLSVQLLQQLRLAVMAMWQPIDCKDVYAASHQTSDAFCKGLIEPINGYWYGLGFCVILYIPILIFSILLISLYRKTEEYYNDESEPNYMNYQGFYMTDMPNSGDSKKKQKKKSKNTSPNSASHEPNVVYSHPHGYQSVSVFAYDAYE